MPMHPLAVERRAHLIRVIAAQGGTVKGLKVDEFAALIGAPWDGVKDHLRRLELFGVIEISKQSIRGQGRLPNEYRLLRSEKWFREHADELEAVHRKRAREATLAARRAEEARVAARIEARKLGSDASVKARARRKVGLPAKPPPPGEPEAKSQPISEALLKKLVADAVENLSVDELAAWGS